MNGINETLSEVPTTPALNSSAGAWKEGGTDKT